MERKPVDEYLATGPVEESSFRSVILFGRNTASYKFALAKALFDLAGQNRDSVTLNQLAVPYTKHLVEHAGSNPRQTTSRSSRFMDACVGYAKGSEIYDRLISAVVDLGFDNVLDAFHTVGKGDVPVRFSKRIFRGDRNVSSLPTRSSNWRIRPRRPASFKKSNRDGASSRPLGRPASALAFFPMMERPGGLCLMAVCAEGTLRRRASR